MTAIIITIVVVSVAGNVAQMIARRNARKETDGYISELAKMEAKMDDLYAKYENEENHRKWAIGRIKDQQAVIDQLKSNKSKYHAKRKEADNA
jgi:uncharacterized membrane protein YhiD involved in acid resistance